MIRLRLNLFRFALQVVTLLLPVLAFFLAADARLYLARFIPLTNPLDTRSHQLLLLFVTVAWGFVFQQYQIAKPESLFATGKKTRQIATSCGVTALLTFAFDFFYRPNEFSRVFIVLGFACLFVLCLVSQVVFRLALEGLRCRKKYLIRALIIGADEYSVETAHRLMCGQITPCEIAGFVRLPGQQVSPLISNPYELEDIPKIAVGNRFDEAILALSSLRSTEIRSLLKKLDPLCVPVRAAIDVGTGVELNERLFNFGGIPLIDMKPTAAESVSYALMKKTFDVAFATLAILITLPLMMVIAIAIILTSRGPLLFVQDRVGLRGHIFRMYKFRTMRVATDKESNMRWTVKDDPRCTRVGAFLRKTSLDELPQFFNVLKGDMSVVGPRPERPYFVDKFSTEFEKYNARHYMNAGITGWAQVNGLRGDTPINQRVNYDLYYLRNWSIAFDLQIILLTLVRGFVHRNAY